MDDLFLKLFSTSQETNESSGTADKMGETFKNMVKSPIFYAVIGGLVLLIIVVYLLRRIIKPRANAVSVVVRGGQIHKLIDEKSNNYFMAPFVDRLGAVISLNEKEFSSDKLFINNGPDALYQINYTLTYKVIDPKEFFKFNDNIQNLIAGKLNDDLREFADAGNALVLVKDYRQNASKILDLINKAISSYSVEALSFKINLIQPLGRK